MSIVQITADRVRQLRDSNGWSQDQLSEESGLAQNTISRIELATNQRVSVSTLKKLANAFKQPFLLDEEQNTWVHPRKKR